MINGRVDVEVIDDPRERAESPGGKAFLRVTFHDGQKVDMTLNIGEMIGGVAKGAQLRFGYVKEQ